MNFEISFGGKTCNFISLYRSPSQSSDNFEDFAGNLQLNLDKISNKSLNLLDVFGGNFNHQIGINMIRQLMKVLKLMQ